MKKKTAENEFPHDGFPIKLIHKDGKDLKDTKTCYFQCMEHAQKYIQRSKFKKKDYKMICKEDEE